MFARTLIASALLAASFAGNAAHADEVKIPAQSIDAKLRAKLPADILAAGEMIAVNNGSFPPYEIVTDSQSMNGASADFIKAISETLGIKIKHASVNGLSPLLLGIKSGRYQFAMGPKGDFPDREASADFIDFVQEYVVFAVPKGNPKGINGLEDTCGKKVAVMAGGSAEKVIRKQSVACTDAGKPAVEVQSYTDQPTSILSVNSKRADTFFSSHAPLVYFVQQSNGALELTSVGKKNGFDDLYQGAVVGKGSPLGPVMLETLQKLVDNGTYAAIMKKWGLGANMLKAPAMNMAGKQAK
ncbi:MAG: ABC transporter substrate-binding protein [Formivibrio sp.]|nr:ABC transporter substrate-binding protein [Formivibrio sp.]